MRPRHMFAIPAYGDSPYLEACIRSLKGQDEPSPIILCTSTPSPFLEQLCVRYEIPMFVRRGKSGIAEDWNFAYQMAEADFVTLAHQDDVYRSSYSRLLLAAARRWPDMTLFTGDYVIVKGDRLAKGSENAMLWIKRLLRLPLRIAPLNDRRAVKRLALCFGNPICCPATAYNKAMLGGPLVRPGYKFALDWDLFARLAERPGRFICEERPLLYYRVHAGAATKACIEDDSRVREEAQMFERFWPRPFARLLLRFYRLAYGEYR